jgi:CRP-like cAMP-binding protein
LQISLKRLIRSKEELQQRINEVIESMEEVSENIENEMKGLSTEIDSKRFSIEEITNFLQTIPEFIELMRLGNGKSFGEKALINNALRAATVVCTRSCHFAVLNKLEYDKVLRKIELKN